MLTKLRRRFILITMGLVGLVLLIVLTVSVVSSYQTARARVEQAALEAVNRGLDAWQRPWIGGLGGGLGGSGSGGGLGSGGDATGDGSGTGETGRPRAQTPSEPDASTLPQESAPFIPVYVVIINSSSFAVLSDNSNFVAIDTSLASEALNRVAEKLEYRGVSPGESLTGLFLDLKLSYRVEVAEDSSTLTIALADASSLIDGTLEQAIISALIWLGAMVAIFFVSLLLGRMALRPVAEAWERQRRFVADASHELKTPLTVILANNSLLLAHPERTIAEQVRWVESTQAEAQRMDALVRDLLLLAQTDERDGGTQRASVGAGTGIGTDAEGAPLLPVDLSALLRRSLLQFEAVFFERGIGLMTDITDGITAPGNAEQLERLVQILLDNASKYAGIPAQGTAAADSAGQNPAGQNPAGRPAVYVVLRPGTNTRQHAVLTVVNSGDAIDPAALPHLFERFYRADSAHSDTEGAGLGLSLAKAIVEAHHGTITVASAAPTGTTFTVSL
jgi:signal transduction histidine kinase